MSPKSPYTKRIVLEWESLVTPQEPLPAGEFEARGKRLYDSCFTDGEWAVGFGDASLVTTLGIRIAFENDDYIQVVFIAQKFLTRKDAQGNDDAPLDEVRSDLGIAQILIGQVEAGIETFDLEFRTGRHPTRFRRHLLSGSLLRVLDSLPPDADALDPLKAFASRLLQRWPGHPGKARLALKVKTNRELRALLDSVHPIRAW